MSFGGNLWRPEVYRLGADMIYVTGDTHIDRDIAKLQDENWPEGQTLTRSDYLVVMGDFGALWYGGERDRRLLDMYESKPYTTLFVDGNHDNFDIIDALPTAERFGAPVHVVPGFPHVIHLMRGYVYELPVSAEETARVLVMGGAETRDRSRRIEGVDWWRREMPSEEEYERCTRSLDDVGWSVDYVFTHELPYDAIRYARDWTVQEEIQMMPDRLSGFLQWVDDKLDKSSLHIWYAGHYHTDRLIDARYRVLYNDILPLGQS